MKILDMLTRKAKKDKDILAVILFGSYARNESFRDIDACLVLRNDKSDAGKKKLEYLAEFPDLDIQVFQGLPLYIRTRILKEGKIIFCKDLSKLYDIAIMTIKDFTYYEPIYREYLEAVLN